MNSNRRLFAVVMTVLLVLSMGASGFVGAAAAQESSSLEVETGTASNVTDTSATLNGTLIDTGGSDEVSVSVVYYEEGDRTTTRAEGAGELSEPGEFNVTVTGLEPDTNYTFYVEAENESVDRENRTEVAGEPVNFTTEPATLGVETGEAEAVTNESAVLTGELTGLGDADSANVSFTYYAEGSPGENTTVEAGNLSEAGAFEAEITGLENNTTYVYVAEAEANGTTVTGEEETFTTDAEGEFQLEEGPFGQNVARFIQYLMSSADGIERNFGQAVSEFVTENNPGADNRPEDAGPPEDRGPDAGVDTAQNATNGTNASDGLTTAENATNASDEERGPPEDRGPDRDSDEEETGDEERGPPEDAGPPEDKGPDSDDSDEEETDEEEETEDEDETEDDSDDRSGGPPDDRGNGR